MTHLISGFRIAMDMYSFWMGWAAGSLLTGGFLILLHWLQNRKRKDDG